LTEAKKVNEDGEEEGNETELQKKLTTIANQIGNVGYAVAILTILGQAIRLVLELNGLIECGTTNLFS
jgi:hypothetical protein